jgi:hypothetical protein
MPKSSNTRYIKQIKQDILNKFKKDSSGAGHALPKVWVEQIYLSQLAEPKRQAFPAAVAELQQEGLIWRNTDRLKLTKKGVDTLFPNNGVSPKRKVRNDILEKFKTMGAKANQPLPFKWAGFTYYPTLNPKQRAVFQQVIQELVNDGLAEFHWDTIKLTALGERQIYG